MFMLHRYITFQTIELIDRFGICDPGKNGYKPPMSWRDKNFRRKLKLPDPPVE
jgi:hypothetical protein